jgi:hypothetical protein
MIFHDPAGTVFPPSMRLKTRTRSYRCQWRRFPGELSLYLEERDEMSECEQRVTVVVRPLRIFVSKNVIHRQRIKVLDKKTRKSIFHFHL